MNRELGPFLLATLPPSPGQRRAAFATILTLLVDFVITAPFRAIQLPRSGAFIAAFQAFVNDLITATLLYAQFSILRWRALLALATGYLFTAHY
jgi:two-component system, sensor histidine kinase and response regulator